MAEKIADAPPSAWIPETNPIILAAIGKLGEEAAECASICCRIAIQGHWASEPVTGKSNLKALAQEIADVRAQCDNVEAILSLDQTYISGRHTQKLNYVQQWMQMLKEKFGG